MFVGEAGAPFLGMIHAMRVIQALSNAALHWLGDG